MSKNNCRFCGLYLTPGTAIDFCDDECMRSYWEQELAAFDALEYSLDDTDEIWDRI